MKETCDEESCCGGSCAGAYGDVHLTTFDGLRYDCQSAGEHILAKVPENGFMVQGRFVTLPNRFNQ